MAYKIKTRYGGFSSAQEARSFAEKHKLPAEGFGYDKKDEHFFETEGTPKEVKEAYIEEHPKKYNGWTNFETWQVALNIENEEGTYHAARDAIADGQITDGRSYKEWFKESFPSQEQGFYKISDGWSDKELDEVNWDEIYNSQKQELKDD